MKFTLEIELGSDAIKSRWVIARAMRSASLQFEQLTVGQLTSINHSPIRDGEYGLVHDINGDLVGKWEVTNPEDDAKKDRWLLP